MKSKIFNYFMSFILMTLVSNVAFAIGNDPIKPLPKVIKPEEETFSVSYEIETEIITEIFDGDKLVDNPYAMPPIITRRQIEASFGLEGQVYFNMKFLTPESELYSKTKDWYDYEIPESESNNEGFKESKVGEVSIKDGVLSVLSTTGQVLQSESLSREAVMNLIGPDIELSPNCQRVYDMIKKAKENGCDVSEDIGGKICITCKNPGERGGTSITVIDTKKNTIETAVELDDRGRPKDLKVYESECRDMKTIMKKIVQEVYKDLNNGQTQVTTIVSSFSNYNVTGN